MSMTERMDWETVSVTASPPGIEVIIKPNDDDEHEDDEFLGKPLVGRAT
jgi:hypothetical protein